jgi:hypothetical protein
MRLTATNSSVSEYGTPLWSVGDPGMPLISSLDESRPNRRVALSLPHQAPPVDLHRPCRGWVRTTAVVHSTVRIFAISAALSRAPYQECRRHSVQYGFYAASRRWRVLAGKDMQETSPSQALPTTPLRSRFVTVGGDESTIIQSEGAAFFAAGLKDFAITAVNLRPVPPVAVITDVGERSACTGS